MARSTEIDRLVRLVLLSLVLWWFPAAGIAQDAGDESSDEAAEDQREQKSKARRAQKAFDEGVAHYERGKYGRAIVEFRKGYAAVPKPLFLYNIAMSQMHLGRPERVLETSAKVFEHEDVDDETKTEVRALQDGSRRVLLAQSVSEAISERRKRRQRADDSDEESSERKEARAEKKTTSPSASDSGRTAGSSDEPPGGSRAKSGSSALLWIGIGSGVLGAGGLAGAAVLNSQLEKSWSELERLRRTPEARDRFEQKREAIKSQQQLARILLYSGSGLVATGAVLSATDLLSSGGESRQPRASVGLRLDGGLSFRLEW